MAEVRDKDASCTMCKKLGLKPVTPSNIMYYYIPACGAVNYGLLSVNVMNPSLISSVFPSRDITNVLLVNSIVGCSFYVYSRPHLKSAAVPMRYFCSGYAAVMFNFGSVLMWAVMRSLIHRNNCVATLLGLLSGYGLTYAGRQYIQYIDELGKPEK